MKAEIKSWRQVRQGDSVLISMGGFSSIDVATEIKPFTEGWSHVRVLRGVKETEYVVCHDTLVAVIEKEEEQ